MYPFLGGGDMIGKVLPESFTTNALPHKYQPRTPNIAGAISLGPGLAYRGGGG